MEIGTAIARLSRKLLVGVVNHMMFPVYIMGGRRPWSKGYVLAKERLIAEAIDKKLFHDCSPPTGFGYRLDERVVEYPWLFSRLGNEPCKLLDAGSALNFQYLLDRSPLSRKKMTIATLHSERNCFWNRNVSYVYGDLRDSYFACESFDEVACISTIEHVGLDNTQLYTPDKAKQEVSGIGAEDVLREFHRILRPGGKLYITFPFGKAELRGWFQVFDLPMVERMIEAFHPTRQHRFFYGYENNQWNRVECEAIRNANFFDVHSDLGYQPDFLAAARGVCCLELTK